MTYTYIPKGVCSRKMTVELNDDHTIQAVRVAATATCRASAVWWWAWTLRRPSAG